MDTRFFYASFGEQALHLLSFVMREYIPRQRPVLFRRYNDLSGMLPGCQCIPQSGSES